MKKLFHQARRVMAKLWLEVNLQLTVVGITGSYAKTTSIVAVAKVLGSKFSVNKTDLNLDTNFNLPITLLKTKIWNEVLVLEYGIDHLGEMDRHLSLVRPKIAVLTGITPVHSDKELLGSLENIIAEKRKLVEAIPEDGLAIFNYDDEAVRKIAKEFKKRKITYGLDKKAALWADGVEVRLMGTKFTLHDGAEKMVMETGLLGFPAVSACLVAYAVAQELKIDKERVRASLKELKPLDGRFSLSPGPMGTVLVNDAKRANPASTLAGLRSLAQFPGRKVAVLGEMGELGELGEEMHRAVGRETAKLKIDLLVGVGPLTKFTVEEAVKSGLKSSQVFWTKDVHQAAETLKKLLEKDDILYLKASLLRHLERIVYLLEGQEIACRNTICHHYGPCATCPRRVK